MTTQVLQALGGLGLFLVGMIVLTEGLRRMAGDAVHRVLFRFTKSPTSGAVTGAAMTAVLQSSSVTTVATVGFVSAGVLAFPQALGVLFGANVGTTITGWMVMLFGFELDIERAVGPLLVAGVLLRLFGRGALAHAGWALAGFAVLFLGLDAMQAGMASFQGSVTPADFPPDTPWGRVLLIGIGVGVTLVTQSSSAGVATALTAVDAGAISFVQGAAMVIGMDVGTTSTTALATLGGSAATKRAGWSHVVYNLLTAVGAYLLLDPFVWVVDRALPGGAAAQAPLALVAFHTLFNALGLIAVLPFTGTFARLMTRVVPEPDGGADPADRLETKLLRDSNTASLTLSGVVRDLSADLFEAVGRALDPAHRPGVDRERLERIDRAVGRARHFADEIVATASSPETQRPLLASMHVVDHLDRLVERCRHDVPMRDLRNDAHLRELAALTRHALQVSITALRAGDEGCGEAELDDARDRIAAEGPPYRQRMMAEAPRPEVALEDVIRRLDAIRWLERSTTHAARIAHNLRSRP